MIKVVLEGDDGEQAIGVGEINGHTLIVLLNENFYDIDLRKPEQIFKLVLGIHYMEDIH